MGFLDNFILKKMIIIFPCVVTLLKKKVVLGKGLKGEFYLKLNKNLKGLGKG